MIRIETGNILSNDAEALVNTVNCVGVMGRGIALQFKKAFPGNFREYKAACDRGEVVPGTMFVHEVHGVSGLRLIINFPTKRHWRGNSRIEDIEAGLVDLQRVLREYRIRSVAIPPLGAGLGGLDWDEVRPRIERAMLEVEVETTIYEPNYVVEALPKTVSPPLTPGRASLVYLMDEYLRGLAEPQISLIEVHKLMYFLQEAGQSLRLNYVPAKHGPYAENLRHVLIATEGHFTTGYRDGGDDPEKLLEIVPGALTDSMGVLAGDEATLSRVRRVIELVSGYETPFGLELLATAHWLLRENDLTDESLVSRVHAWHPSKLKFTPTQVIRARRRLESAGWA